jgi:hypothetical protein
LQSPNSPALSVQRCAQIIQNYYKTQVGTIARNSSLEIEVPCGGLRIEARIDWGRSLPLVIDAAPNQNIDIEVLNEWPFGLAFWAVTFGFRRYLTLKPLWAGFRAT